MKEQLKELKSILEYNEETKELIKEINKEAKDKIEQLKEERLTELYETKELELKETIKQIALNHFKETNNKSLEGGIGIRETTKYEYDKDRALKWAKDHNLCLQLDEKAFKAIIKTQDLRFVTKNKIASVTFPSEIKIIE